MLKLILVLVCLVALCYATEQEQFDAFISKYNKKYSAGEYAARFANFQESLKRVASYGTEGANFGITKFSDMSVDDFKNIILMKKTLGTVDTNNAEPFSATAGLPTEFDWRQKGGISAVKNQGECGSCWAFSATEAIESANILKGKATTSINLSPQQIVDCDHDFVLGCNGGRTSAAYSYIIKVGGQEGISNYPYTAHDGFCKFNSSDIELSISTYQSIARNESALQGNLYNIGPLSICLDAAHWQDYKSGVLTHTQCCPLGICELDHCVQLVGYNTTGNYWTVRNSWGTDWGLDGFIQLEMGYNTCGFLDDITFPAV